MMSESNESLQAAEAECAAGRTAPRISLGKIEETIVRTKYFTADQVGVEGGDKLTICIATCRNSFFVVGKSAPISAANFDPELGRKLSYEDCVRQLWPKLAYAYYEKLMEVTDA